MMWVPFVILCFAVMPVTGLSGHFENVAVHKESRVSSQYATTEHFPVHNAVNNDTRGDFGIDNCVHTADSDHQPWWEVNLGRAYPVQNITVWARYGWAYRLAGSVITVDGQLCYRFGDGPYPLYKRDYPITCTEGVLNGSVVRMTKDNPRQISNGTINICEFQVFSCSDTYWGSACDRRCGHCQPQDDCDKVTGHCNCSPGWTPPLCQKECVRGRYGQDCQHSCSEGCDGDCDRVTGTCTCTPGWKGLLCDTECPSGHYGPYCRHNCSDHCNNICDKATGQCKCSPGYQTPTCVTECVRGWYGQDCQYSCSKGCGGDCDRVTGTCTCTPGWKGLQCDTADDSSDTALSSDVDSSDNTLFTGVAVGIGVMLAVAVLVALTVVAVVVIRRRRQRVDSHRPLPDHYSGSSIDRTEPKWQNIYQNIADAGGNFNKPSPDTAKPATCGVAEAGRQEASGRMQLWETTSQNTALKNPQLSSAPPLPWGPRATERHDVKKPGVHVEEGVYDIMNSDVVVYDDLQVDLFGLEDEYMTLKGRDVYLDPVQEDLVDRAYAEHANTELKVQQWGSDGPAKDQAKSGYRDGDGGLI